MQNDSAPPTIKHNRVLENGIIFPGKVNLNPGPVNSPMVKEHQIKNR